MLTFALALLIAVPHLEQNPLYAELLKQGVKLGPTATTPLPAEAMPDGLSAAQQREALEKLPNRQVPVEELLRPSTVSPFVLRFREIESGQPQAPGRGVDLYFIAQGKLDDLAKSDFLDRLLNSGRKDAQIKPLPAEQLAARGIKPEGEGAARAGWAHVAVPLMDRVTLQGVNQTMWSRTTESLVVAARLDPRFATDKVLPNQWRLLKRDADGKPQPDGPPHPYEAVAYTLKLTELKEPAGLLFVEWHLAYAEPEAWFDGANLLRSKLPLVLQTKVRGFRRDLLRDAKP